MDMLRRLFLGLVLVGMVFYLVGNQVLVRESIATKPMEIPQPHLELTDLQQQQHQQQHSSSTENTPTRSSSSSSSEDFNRTRSEVHIVGFYHLEAANEWKEIMTKQLSTLKQSGLLRATSKLYIGILSPKKGIENEVVEVVRKMDPLLEVYWWTQPKIGMKEKLTLSILHEFCLENSNYNVYYFSSKGSYTYKGSTKYKLAGFWRTMTEHFIFERWQDIQLLFLRDTGVEVAGVNLFCHPYPHFSGNYWWATCRYLRSHTTPKTPTPKFAEILATYPHRYDEVWVFDAETNKNDGRRSYAAECHRDLVQYPYGFVSELPKVLNLTCKEPRLYQLPIVEEECLKTPSVYPLFQ